MGWKTLFGRNGFSAKKKGPRKRSSVLFLTYSTEYSTSLISACKQEKDKIGLNLDIDILKQLVVSLKK